MKRTSLINTILVLFIFCSICYVPLRNYKQNGLKAAFEYFASDAFYYINVAEKSANLNYFSYDGTKPVNGFHPLWQWLLTYSFKFIDSKEAKIEFVFLLSIILTAAGFSFIWLSINKITRNLILSLLSVLPGYFFIFFSFGLKGYNSPWASANGMETPLLIFFFGLFFFFFLSKDFFKNLTKAKIFFISVILTIIFLTRLDDIFLLLVFGGFLFMQSEKSERTKNLFLYSVLPVVTIIIYIIYNISYCGMALPVSSSEKSSLSLLNFIHIFNVLIIGGTYNNFFGEHGLWRVLQLVVPLISAIFVLFYEFKKQKTASFNNNTEIILILLASYIFLKAVFHLLFIDFWHQGSWYFAVSIISINFFAAFYLSKLKIFELKSYKLILSIIYIFFFINSFMYYMRFNQEKEKNYNFWERREIINNEIKQLNTGKGIIEFDDGIVAFGLNIPAKNGIGLNLDKQAHDAKRNGEFINYAYNEGFTAISSVNYFDISEQQIFDSVKLNNYLKDHFNSLKNQNLRNFNFKLLFRDKISGFTLIEIIKEK